MMMNTQSVQLENAISGTTPSVQDDGHWNPRVSLDQLLNCDCLMNLSCPATSAENEVASLFVNGLTYSEIADIRHVSIETIRTQVSSLLSKTGTKHRTEFIKLVLSANLNNVYLASK